MKCRVEDSHDGRIRQQARGRFDQGQTRRHTRHDLAHRAAAFDLQSVGPAVTEFRRLQQRVEGISELLAVGHGENKGESGRTAGNAYSGGRMTPIVGESTSSALSQPRPAAIQRRASRASTGASQGISRRRQAGNAVCRAACGRATAPHR